MTTSHEIQQICEDFAIDLAQVIENPKDWGEWLVYLLEQLDHKASPGGPNPLFDVMLADLRDDIQKRLNTGKW
jgi:hypothetical protein